jgi:nicotinate dehydrogenase subunit B
MGAIRLVMADTDLTPYERGTFGSRTTPIMSLQLRKIAAAARRFLLEVAAEAWGAEPATLAAREGRVVHPASDRSAAFGELVAGREALITTGDGEPVTPAEHWTIAGRSVPKVDGRTFVTGSHRYTSDQRLPGMLYGKVLRPPAFRATLLSVDTRAAEAMDGVVVVRDGDFVGVAAPEERAAAQAVEAIRARWRTELQVSHPELFDYLRESPLEDSERARPFQYTEGSVAEAMAAASRTLEQSYTVDYIAHAPLEPRAALARWTDEGLTVWTGTQRPFGVRTELAEAFGLPEEQVQVIVVDTGSGYGGKHSGDAAVEAARLARAAGRPVKLVWTREEEFTWAYFRPAGVIDVASGVQDDGAITAWALHNYNSGAAGIHTLYAVPNQHVEFHPTESPLRQGSYRALSATANHFARETHIDELAYLLGRDPLAFRLQNLPDPRLRAVLEAAARAFGWGETEPGPDHGFGLAAGAEKGSYVATCAEVRVDRPGGTVQVVRVVEACECGAVVNPNHLRSQIEGCIVQGLGGALFESIRFANGRILNPSFADYRVPRFGDAPAIEVVLVDRKDLPSVGAGETPIVTIAPAVGNAIFAATGVRLRSLPLSLEGNAA